MTVPASAADVAPFAAARDRAAAAPVTTLRVKVVGTGFYAPAQVETTCDIAPRIGKDAEWVSSRTGVLQRRVSAENMALMGARAAREALGQGPPPDLILNASAIPQQLIPDSSVFIEQELGYEGIPSHSIHATCLSFLVALHAAACYLSSGVYNRILIVSSEVATPGRNYAQPESASLFGDGAAAAVVETPSANESSGLLGWRMQTWPRGAGLSEVRGCGTRCHPNSPATRQEDNLFTMDGRRLYRMARSCFAAVFHGALQDAGLTATDLDVIIPHQASRHGIDAFTYFDIPPAKIVSILRDYGNCVAASIPMALALAQREGRLRRGCNVLLGGAGAGLSVGVAILRW
jgi:3-oxoacyl-[acyl-carrier-protein] synthase III